MRFALTNAVIISGALLLSACSSTSMGNKVPIEDRSLTKQNENVANKDGLNASGAKTAAIESRAVETIVVPPTQSKNDAAGIPPKRSIYFDYNSFAIRNDSQPLIEAHAKYLNTKKGQKIIIQGNTDDRGGREYNLALGQKRAEAVRKSLSLLNVPESQMEAVSFGKEKPKALGSNEASWAENRRSDIIYQ
jgi:peptidoglycan-associated lipoprotein